MNNTIENHNCLMFQYNNLKKAMKNQKRIIKNMIKNDKTLKDRLTEDHIKKLK